MASVYIRAADTHRNEEYFSIYNEQFKRDAENGNQSESLIAICHIRYAPAIIRHRV